MVFVLSVFAFVPGISNCCRGLTILLRVDVFAVDGRSEQAPQRQTTCSSKIHFSKNLRKHIFGHLYYFIALNTKLKFYYYLTHLSCIRKNVKDIKNKLLITLKKKL